MEFLEVVRKRRMVRNFTDEPVPHETLEGIIATAQRAPSAGFSQGVVFVTVTDPGTRATLGALAGEEQYTTGGFDPFISGAPVQVVICVNEQLYHDRYNESDKVDDEGKEIFWPVPYWHTDAGCSLMLLLLAAVNEGLGTAFVGVWEQEKIQELLGIPADYFPVGIAMIGHAAPDKRSGSLKRGFRPLDAIWHQERWYHDQMGRAMRPSPGQILPANSRRLARGARDRSRRTSSDPRKTSTTGRTRPRAARSPDERNHLYRRDRCDRDRRRSGWRERR